MKLVFVSVSWVVEDSCKRKVGEAVTIKWREKAVNNRFCVVKNSIIQLISFFFLEKINVHGL